ncbi:proteasome assembly chaperone family protein [Halorubrum vacuolatum]|uniref:Proteasome assembly chaperone family protein n=1 Tax=Halorubrum vacuolatum TaxID=63740 RepID=A0A238VDE6_HALVU|nr:PAC2 family protein [Halorubrum vacuolatum]SNR31713.1 uncharacterized protein SAMN06264855_102216 [Halorubrum vacuolatum]
MSQITVVEEVPLNEPVLVEGFPGIGLVGKIAADHLVDVHGMVHHANVHCEGLPPVVTYAADNRALRTPVRLYADPETELMALQSDVPVTPAAAVEFAECFAGWYEETEVLPLFLSGLPREKDVSPPDLYGLTAGPADPRAADVDLEAPPESGLISGPTGAMLADALRRDLSAVGLIVESDPQFPDPEAARTLIVDGIDPIADIETPIEGLTDQAEEIKEAKEAFARRMQQANEESSQAEPLKMYQ